MRSSEVSCKVSQVCLRTFDEMKSLYQANLVAWYYFTMWHMIFIIMYNWFNIILWNHVYLELWHIACAHQMEGGHFMGLIPLQFANRCLQTPVTWVAYMYIGWITSTVGTWPTNEQQPSFTGPSKPRNQHMPAVKLGIKGMIHWFWSAVYFIIPILFPWHSSFSFSWPNKCIKMTKIDDFIILLVMHA